MPLKQDGPAPYGPPGPLLEVLNRYRDRGLQTPFTKEVLAKAGVSDSLTSRVLQSMTLLGLIDADGNPESVLLEYAKAPQEDVKSHIDQLVKDVYAPVFAFVNPATDPPSRIRDAFRSYQPRSMQDRMVTLFLGLCQYAGIATVSPKITAKSAASMTRVGGQATDLSFRIRRSGPRTKNSTADAPALTPVDGLPDVVQGVLRELAAIGPTWTQDQRDRFTTVWNAVLDFSYPVHREDAGPNGDEKP